MAETEYKSYVTLVYAGVRMDSKNKRTHVYVPLADNELDPNPMFFDKPLMKLSIGSVTKHGRTDKNTTQMRGEYVGFYRQVASDKEKAQKQVDEWVAQEARDKCLIEMAAQTGGNLDLQKLLAPIGKAYYRTNAQGRAALLAKVMLAIQSYRD